MRTGNGQGCISLSYTYIKMASERFQPAGPGLKARTACDLATVAYLGYWVKHYCDLDQSQGIFGLGFIPEGCLRIAQRFNVGEGANNEPRPEGTVGREHGLSRPFGTCIPRTSSERKSNLVALLVSFSL